jgi:hypothetical protein
MIKLECNSCGYAELVRDKRQVHCPECQSTDIEFQSDPLAESRAVPEVDQDMGVPSFLKASPQSPSQPPSRSLSQIRLDDVEGGGNEQEETMEIREYVKIDKQIKPVLGVIGFILAIVGLVLLVSSLLSEGSDFRQILFLRNSNFFSFLFSGAILLSSGSICVYAGVKYNPGVYTKEEVKVFLKKVATGLFGLIFALEGLSLINSSLRWWGSTFLASLITGLIFLMIGLICVYVGIKYSPGKYTKEEIATFLGKVFIGIVGAVMFIGGIFLAFMGFLGGGGSSFLAIGVTLVIIGFIILAVVTKGEICDCCSGC